MFTSPLLVLLISFPLNDHFDPKLLKLALPPPPLNDSVLPLNDKVCNSFVAELSTALMVLLLMLMPEPAA